jgi:hypothetical protein
MSAGDDPAPRGLPEHFGEPHHRHSAGRDDVRQNLARADRGKLVDVADDQHCGNAARFLCVGLGCPLMQRQRMTIRPPEYKPPPRTTYTDLGWIFAALTGPATLLVVWIYCAVTYGFFLGFGLGWIPALILALLVAVATIFLWPLAVAAVLYVIYRVFGVHPELLIYIAAFVGIIAIAMIWWWM